MVVSGSDWLAVTRSPTDTAATSAMPSSGLVIQQVPGPHGGAYTVVAAGTPERLELAMQAVTMPALWSQLGGSSLVYDEIDQTLRPIAVETPVRYVATQPGSIANWRLVLAGMFSAHPWLYTLVLLSLAVATALMAGRWLARAGQEP